MTVEPTPDRAHLRISDADRNEATKRLSEAAGEGRIGFDELDERVAAVYEARTYADLVPIFADLPGPGHTAAAHTPTPAPRKEEQHIEAIGSSLVREGTWVVPRRLKVTSHLGSTKLDFTQAIITDSEVSLEVRSNAGSTTLIVPDGTHVDTDDVAMSFGSVKNKAANGPGPLRIHVTGSHRAGSLTVRYLRRWRIGKLTIHFPCRITWG